MIKRSAFGLGAILILILVILYACSGGKDPVTGDIPSDTDLGMSGVTDVVNNKLVISYGKIFINTSSGSVEMLPDRSTEYHINVLPFIQPPKGNPMCFGIELINDYWTTQGRMDVDLTFTHPLPEYAEYSIFDVMGVIITGGNQHALYNSGVTYSDGGEVNCTVLNADGYTRWYNRVEFNNPLAPIFSHVDGAYSFDTIGLNATINPYKYYATGLSATGNAATFLAGNVDTRGILAPGSLGTRRFELQWPMVGGSPILTLDYAYIASWVEPDVIPPENVPDDFPLAANALEPVAAKITDYTTLWKYKIGEIPEFGGQASLEIEAFGWQGLAPNVSLPSIISRVILEIPDSEVIPGGSYHVFNSGNWKVAAGSENSSVWTVEIPDLVPEISGTAPAMVILETIYTYNNGSGLNYPSNAQLTSYFPTTIRVLDSEPVLPTVTAPVPGQESRTWIDFETFTTDIEVEGGGTYTTRWSVAQTNQPREWVTVPYPGLSYTVNWSAETNQGANANTDYDVVVRVSNQIGIVEKKTVVKVDNFETSLMPVYQNVHPNSGPNHGGQPADIAVLNVSTGPYNLLLNQTVSEGTKMLTYNYNLSGLNSLTTLTHAPTIPSDLAPGNFRDFHKFDVHNNGNLFQISSSCDTTPSLNLPNSLNSVYNDPYHGYILPYNRITGNLVGTFFYGDGGSEPSYVDPDALPWKHVVDWTNGTVGFSDRMYGLMTISERWMQTGGDHNGSIFGVYSWWDFSNPNNNYQKVDLHFLSSQVQAPFPPLFPYGPVNDTNPDLMAVAVDDEVVYEHNFAADPYEFVCNSDVWYILSAELTAIYRKVHIVLLPRDLNIYNVVDPLYISYDYRGYIGYGSSYGVDFDGGIPVDIEMINTSDQMGTHYNWLAVLIKDGTHWRVDIIRYDIEGGGLAMLDTGDFYGLGDPTALDVDPDGTTIHVLHKTGSTYYVTILDFNG